MWRFVLSLSIIYIKIGFKVKSILLDKEKNKNK
jgi:hypothetical protein